MGLGTQNVRLPGIEALPPFFMMLVMPGLLEELIFRGVLFQFPNEVTMGETSRPALGEQIAALWIFLVYHLDVLHVPKASVFYSPCFLMEAAILGIFVQEALLRTNSLWPGIIMHWMWVWLGIFFGGGFRFMP